MCQGFFIYPWFLPGVLLSLKATKIKKAGLDSGLFCCEKTEQKGHGRFPRPMSVKSWCVGGPSPYPQNFTSFYGRSRLYFQQ